MSAPADFRKALEHLVDHRVDFLIVGGVAATLHGSPRSTFDLDILYDTEPTNVERLAAALSSLEALYRDPAGRRIAPTVDRLAVGGHHRTLTSAGPLDLLGYVGSQRRYGDLLPGSEEATLGEISVRVIGLEDLIEVKRETGRDRDKQALPDLLAVLALRSSD